MASEISQKRKPRKGYGRKYGFDSNKIFEDIGVNNTKTKQQTNNWSKIRKQSNNTLR